MKVGTWNVNSLRARHDHTLKFLDEESPDVLCLQETKLTDDKFPHEALKKAGYEHLAWFGQPTYNGVAIVSRLPLEDVQKGFDAFDDDHKRVIAATVGGVRIYGLYVPNGNRVGSDKFDYKLRWLDALAEEIDRKHSSSDDLIVCGDMNIAPDDLDVWDPFATEGKLLCHPKERGAFERLIDWGLVDSFREEQPFETAFTWWDYRQMGFQRNQGMRIDHLLITESLSARMKGITIHRDVRGWDTPSDHVPVVLELQ